MAKTVASYLKSAPAAHQPALQLLRKLIKRYFPMAKETMSGAVRGGAFPLYTADGVWVAGFSVGKGGVTFHLSDPVTLDGYQKYLGGQRTGQTSVVFAGTKEIELQSLAEVVEECLAASVLFRGLDGPKKWQTGGPGAGRKKTATRKAGRKKVGRKAPAKKAAKKTPTRKKKSTRRKR